MGLKKGLLGITYEGFGRVCEWHRTCSRRVDHHEQVDTCTYASESGLFTCNEEGEACKEQTCTHHGKSGKKEVSTATK